MKLNAIRQVILIKNMRSHPIMIIITKTEMNLVMMKEMGKEMEKEMEMIIIKIMKLLMILI